jgi:uncharacterized protein YoxC
MLWPIPAVCAAVAVICMLVGVVAVLRERREVQAHVRRLQANVPKYFDSGRLTRAVERIGSDAEGARALLDRAAASARTIGASLRDLRLREAIVALRLAAAAVRHLTALH